MWLGVKWVCLLFGFWFGQWKVLNGALGKNASGHVIYVPGSLHAVACHGLALARFLQ